MGKIHEGFGEFAKKEKESCPTHKVLLTAQSCAGELLLPLVMPRPDSRRAEPWGITIPTNLSACTAGIHTNSTPRRVPSPPPGEFLLSGFGPHTGRNRSRNCWQQLCRIARLCRTLYI